LSDLSGVLSTDGSYATLRLADGVITAVERTAPASTDAPLLVPGLVDLQVNGVADVDFGTAPDAQAIARGLDALTDAGTTSCLATVVTAPLRQYDALLDRLRAARDLTDAATRCTLLGVHLEGPFLGGAPGAHPRDLVRDVDLGWLRALLLRHGDLVRMVTLAPEADPDFAATRMLCDAGVLVAIGHSTCSSSDAVAAADAGARAVTHLFNSMSGLHHRTPGIVAAALLDDRLTPTLIPDLVHVHPEAIRVALAAKPDIAIVTDAVAPATGASGGLHIVERGGAAYLDDGTLAGSVLTMDTALRNLISLGVSLPRAVIMASTLPCDLLGLTHRGRLEPGAVADIVVLAPDTLAVEQVWIAGEQVR
jgi:N-acetylglucosamine-6-phosphate deacetylase